MYDPHYRYSRLRSRPPRILATPSVYSLLTDRSDGQDPLRQVIAKCLQISRDPGTKLTGGYDGLGAFHLDTIWSGDPAKPDVFVLSGPGDAIWERMFTYEKTWEESCLSAFLPISVV